MPSNIPRADVSLLDLLKSLGVTTDSRLTFDRHVNKICQTSYLHIRALWHVRGAMSTDIAQSFARAIVGAQLDYRNSLLYGVSAANLHKLQRIQNTLARDVTRTKKT